MNIQQWLTSDDLGHVAAANFLLHPPWLQEDGGFAADAMQLWWSSKG